MRNQHINLRFRALDKALSAYLRLADAHYKNSSRFHAAKALEEAGKICKDLKKISEGNCFLLHAFVAVVISFMLLLLSVACRKQPQSMKSSCGA